MADRHQSKAYTYLFNRVPPYYATQRNYAEAADLATLCVRHTIEQVNLSNNLVRWPRHYDDVDLRLANIASSYLVNFATSGNPNVPVATTAAGNVLRTWPAMSTSRTQVMSLDDVIAAVPVPYQKAFELFDGVYAQRLGTPLAFQ